MIFLVINMTIVFKVSDNIKDKMIKHYEYTRRDKTPPYALFQASDAGTIITLYESGKVVFQGESADIDANIWIDLESSINKRDINAEIAEKDSKKEKEEVIDNRFKNVSTIGSDEVGTGDYFGPIIVTAAYVSTEHMNLLYDLGVRDSKKTPDSKIMEIAPTIIKNIPHVNHMLTNKEYNNLPAPNMNKIKAILHNKALCDLIKKEPGEYKYIVVDQFAHPRNYFSYIKEAKERCTKITFVTKAEDKCLSVAAASIISRYLFLKEMKKLGDSLNIFLKKGAGAEVDKQGAMIVSRYGETKLFDIAKLNFKNTEKIKKIIEEESKK